MRAVDILRQATSVSALRAIVCDGEVVKNELR